MLGHDAGYKVLSPGACSLKAVEKDGAVRLYGKKIDPRADKLYSRLLGTTKVALVPDDNVRVRWILALDDTYRGFLNDFLPDRASGPEQAGIEVIDLSGYDICREWQKVVALLDERIASSRVAPGDAFAADNAGPAPETDAGERAVALADTIKIHAFEAAREESRIIIGIETSAWMPHEQADDMQALSSAVRRFADTLTRRGVVDNVKVVLGNRETLLGNIANEKPAAGDKVVVLGSEGTLTSDDFRTLENAFLACIDTGRLDGSDYIDLMQMLSVAIRLALGKDDIASVAASHPDIIIKGLGARIVRLTPLKRIDTNEPAKIYRLQIRELGHQA